MHPTFKGITSHDLSPLNLESYTHASISGVVLAIEKCPIPHPSGIDGMCIVIDSDGKDKWIEIEKCDQDFLRCAPSKVIQRIPPPLKA
jgi:electron transport complex protein RnfC